MEVEIIDESGFKAIALKTRYACKHIVTVDLSHDPNGGAKKAFEHLRNRDAEIVAGLAFGDCGKLRTILAWDGYLPVTTLQGDTCSCGVPTAVQLTAVSGADVAAVTLDGKRLGSKFVFDGFEHCVLSGIHAKSARQIRGDDAREAFYIMGEALATVGFDFSNVIRMWNYLDNLLEWYPEFNTVRNAFFEERKVYDAVVPAGTGIGTANEFGTAYIGDLWAVKPAAGWSISDNHKAFPVPSPLQCPAIDYKSSFSRAVELDSPNFRTLSISGTASIEQGGMTVHVGDTEKQINKTLEVIDAILKSRDMGWSDTVRAIAYFAEIDDLPLLYERLAAYSIPSIPIAISHAAICRDDLLFEMELDAVSPTYQEKS